MRVLSPGTCSSLQDLGRFGSASLGIGTAGAMDTWAARVANLLLDNVETAAVLEMTLVGAELELLAPAWIAVTGADLDARCDGAPLPLCRPVAIAAGSVLRFRAARRGCRAYLAIRGGFAGERFLGSAATDARAGVGGMGGRTLRRGDVLVGDRSAQRHRQGGPCAPWSTSLAAPREGTARLAFVPGAAWSRLERSDRERIGREPLHVSTDADRMGIRLRECLSSAAALTPILSQGVVFGAIQLPPDGRPILLGADRQTTGGYPLLGVVAGVDHTALAQLRPGDALQLHVTRVSAAQAAWRAREQRLARLRLAVQSWWRREAMLEDRS